MRRQGGILALAMTAALTGCATDQDGDPGTVTTEGTDGDAAALPQRLAAAQIATQEAGSASFELVQELGGQRLTGEGAVTFDGDRARVTLEAPLPDGTTTDLTTIVDGSTVYTQLPQEVSPTPTTWVRFDLEELPPGMGFDSVQDVTGDPSQQLAFLAGAMDVREAGREDVDGVPTTRYAYLVDLDASATTVEDDELRAFVERTREQLGTSVIPAQVWIDEERRIRRQVTEIPAAAVEGSTEAPAPLVTTVEYDSFGIEVDVTPPPEGDVTDLEELQRQATPEPTW